jgi:hypothetical protein
VAQVACNLGLEEAPFNARPRQPTRLETDEQFSHWRVVRVGRGQLFRRLRCRRAVLQPKSNVFHVYSQRKVLEKLD